MVSSDLLLDIEALNAHLDEHPEDHGARLALSDAYEEAGDDHKARCLRLLVKYDKYPFYGVWAYGHWDWFCQYDITPMPNNLPGLSTTDPAFDPCECRLELEIIGAEHLVSRGYC